MNTGASTPRTLGGGGGVKLLEFPLPHPVSADGLAKNRPAHVSTEVLPATVSILISDLKDGKIMTAESRCFQMEPSAQSGC